jgi:hypothetical protein
MTVTVLLHTTTYWVPDRLAFADQDRSTTYPSLLDGNATPDAGPKCPGSSNNFACYFSKIPDSDSVTVSALRYTALTEKSPNLYIPGACLSIFACSILLATTLTSRYRTTLRNPKNTSKQTSFIDSSCRLSISILVHPTCAYASGR